MLVNVFDLCDLCLDNHLVLLRIGPEVANLETGVRQQGLPGALCTFRGGQQGHHLHIHGGLANAGSGWREHDVVDEELGVALDHRLPSVNQQFLGLVVGPIVKYSVHEVSTAPCSRSVSKKEKKMLTSDEDR